MCLLTVRTLILKGCSLVAENRRRFVVKIFIKLPYKVCNQKTLVASIFACFLMTVGCGQEETPSYVKEAWNGWNDPTILQEMGIGEMSNYQTTLKDLPLKSSLELDDVWSGDYWPSFLGGISQRWNTPGWENELKSGYQILSKEEVKESEASVLESLSPAEKYDIASNDYGFSLTRLERERTGILKTFPSSSEYEEGFYIPEWEGLCHGWAPATIEFKEPHPVEFENSEGIKVPMYSSDIKALLSYLYHYQSPKSTILGTRCYEDPPDDMDALFYKVERGEVNLTDYKEALKKDYEAQKFGFNRYLELLHEARSVESCSDSNAGAFHIVLTNQIGRMQQGFVMDVTREAEVWNQGVVGYDARELARHTGENLSKGVAAGTVEEVEFETSVYYLSEVSTHKDPADYSKASAIVSAEYHYKVELDGDGQIIGGSWVSYDRPDFVWKQDRPKFEGYFKTLGKIYDLSINQHSVSDEGVN